MEKKNPKVFICHASEDKERFVLDFAKKLREKGVDAWVDKWEIQLGDNLVDKIFEEGIKECNTCIIILSKFSVTKPWVKEELSSAVVKRIEENIKLIPIVIDKDIEIPQSIKHLLRKPINDLSNYEEEFKDILMSIYGVTSKPPLGEEPSFATKIRSIPGFSKVDSTTLKIVGEIIYAKDDVGRLVNANEVIEKALPFELTKEEVIDSLEVLESNGYWEISRNIGGIEWSNIIVTSHGFIKYCEIFIKEFDEIFKGVISSIMNEGLKTSAEIASKLRCKLVMVNSLLDYFENCGYIGLVREVGRRGAIIFKITAEGKRYFENALL